MANQSVGIDFGTSNSTCALFNGHGARLIALEDGKITLPSAIFFCEDERVLFGRQAIQAYIDGEDGRLMRGLKSVLGTSLMKEKTIVNKIPRTFLDILRTFIAHIKTKAEGEAGTAIENAVFGRPVHFHDDNSGADQESEQVLGAIGRSVGFKNIVFQYEPIAAAFAHERHLLADRLALVVDLGGGTSDFAIVRLSPFKGIEEDRKRDILGTSGVRVGGTTFDTLLSMASFMPDLGLNSPYRSPLDAAKVLQVPARIFADLSDWPKVNSAQTSQAVRESESLLRTALEPWKLERLVRLQREKLGHAHLQTVERMKIALSSHEMMDLPMSHLGFDYSVTVARQEFHDAIATRIDKIVQSLDLCLSTAGVRPGDVDLVVLTGGSSELPIINQIVLQKFPDVEISKDDKFGSVGLGLAYNAGQVFASRTASSAPLSMARSA